MRQKTFYISNVKPPKTEHLSKRKTLEVLQIVHCGLYSCIVHSGNFNFANNGLYFGFANQILKVTSGTFIPRVTI